MFKDFKAGGFNLEDTWTDNINMQNFIFMYLYCLLLDDNMELLVLDKKNKLIGATKY